MTRADRNNNPAAFTTDIARQAGLVAGEDFSVGDPFPPIHKADGTLEPSKLFTARLLGDPVSLTIKVIDTIGYVTAAHVPRWTYINIPSKLWWALTDEQKRIVVSIHYANEGGTLMAGLFA